LDRQEVDRLGDELHLRRPVEGVTGENAGERGVAGEAVDESVEPAEAGGYGVVAGDDCSSEVGAVEAEEVGLNGVEVAVDDGGEAGDSGTATP